MSVNPHKPPLTIDEQILNLKSIGLIITNEDHARSLLNDISYFRLIKAYSLGLKQKNGNYYENTRFEDIEELYLFDSNLRHLIFPFIERVEINLRCRLVNYFSSRYGIFGYEDSANFIDPSYHSLLKDDINAELDRNKRSPFVKNFIENYTISKLPFYAVVELFSFGNLSKFFKNMKNVDKKNIAMSYDVGYIYLESWFESISYVRNICAHYGRLYNAKLPKTPKLYKQYTKMGVGNNRVFSILICIRHLLLNDKHWNDFVNEIELLLYKYPKVERQKIGFVDSWKNILLQKS